jgi:hypothetical protein
MLSVGGPPLDWVNAACFSPDGRVLAVAGAGLAGNTLVGPAGAREDYTIHLWDVSAARMLPPVGQHAETVTWVAFSPDGRTLAAVTWNSSIQLWERDTGLLRAVLVTGDNVARVAFSPDGRFLVSTNDGSYPGGYKWTGKEDWNAARIWDLARGKEVHRFVGHRSGITAAAFRPDGGLLASAGRDTNVLLWDMTNVYAKVRQTRVALAANEVEKLGKDLCAGNGIRAYQAVWSLAAAPDQAVRLLQERVRPVLAADAGQVARWAAALESDRFADRQRSMRELEKLGVRAKPELRKHLARVKSEEQRRRLQILLEKPEEIALPGPRVVEVLERIGFPTARDHLQALASGVPEARLTQAAVEALKRLARVGLETRDADPR